MAMFSFIGGGGGEVDDFVGFVVGRFGELGWGW